MQMSDGGERRTLQRTVSRFAPVDHERLPVGEGTNEALVNKL